MARSKGIVTNMLGRVTRIREEGITTQTSLYIVLAVVVVFLILYYVFRR